VTTIPGNNTQTTYDRTLAAISGETGAIPIWWAAAHTLSKSITAASIASIPCAPDLSSVEYRLAEDIIEDPGLRKEVAEFTDDCYRRSRSRLMRSDTSALTAAQLEDSNWLGSAYFRITAGYYDRYYAQQPQASFPFNATRDAGFDADAITGGHPGCNEWWSDAAIGIRRKVLDSLDPNLLNEMVYNADNLIDESTDTSPGITEREDILLRKYMAVTRARESLSVNLPMSTGYQRTATDRALDSIDQGSWSESLLGGISLGASFVQDVGRTALVGLGAAIKAPEAIGEGYMIRQGISLFQALILMIMVIVLPFLMIFSQYRLSTLMTLTIIFFGLHFLSFLWAIAYWLDNQMMALMTEGGRFGVFEPVANPVQSGIILWVQRFLYLMFP
ncbi:MAG: conjugal transfer protein TraG N-terminal domain-containing protein, partial [Pseudohongiellaceae bacterium]